MHIRASSKEQAGTNVFFPFTADLRAFFKINEQSSQAVVIRQLVNDQY